ALKQSRRGMQFDPDTALSNREVSGKTSSGVPLSNGLKMIVDDWGYPLVLFRWPYGSPDLNPNGPQTGLLDREDPEGLLASAASGSFSNDIHPTPGRGRTYKMEPTIVSAGENSNQPGYPGIFAVLQPSMAPSGNPMANSCIYSCNLRMGGHGNN